MIIPSIALWKACSLARKMRIMYVHMFMHMWMHMHMYMHVHVHMFMLMHHTHICWVALGVAENFLLILHQTTL